jgi:hypothetical protein
VLMAAGDATPDLLTPLVQYGPLGIVLLLILVGLLVPKGSVEQIKIDRDEWRDAFRAEQKAHQSTRDALAEANGRAEAAVEAARTTAGMLRDLGHPNVRSAGP